MDIQYDTVKDSQLALYVDGTRLDDVFGVLVRRRQQNPLYGKLWWVGVFASWPSTVTPGTAFSVRSVREPQEWFRPVAVEVARPVANPLGGGFAVVDLEAENPVTPNGDVGGDPAPPFESLDGDWVTARRAEVGAAFDAPLAALVGDVPPESAAVPVAFTRRTFDGFENAVLDFRLCKLWGGCD